MSDYNQQQGALERLGIPVETTPPEEVLTSGQARSIRFRVSRPAGYAFGDVESFIFEMLQPTLEWYGKALHQRDLEVHKLGEELDRVEVDNLNLKAQLDNKELNEAFGEAVDSSERDEEVDALVRRVKTLEEENARLQTASTGTAAGMYTQEQVDAYVRSAVAAKQAEMASAGAGDYTEDEVNQMITAAVTKREQELLAETSSTDLAAENKTLRESVTALEEYSNQLEEYSAQLEEALKAVPQTQPAPAPATTVPPTTQAPAAYTGVDGRPLPNIRPDDL